MSKKEGIKVNIFIIGLTSSNLGGMEFHNLGNYAIMEPLIIFLKKEFPHANISMSIQMSDNFCREYNVKSHRDKRFWTYGFWTGIATARDIILISIWSIIKYSMNIDIDSIINSSKLLKVLKNSDIIIDFSGDIYGDNANYRQFFEDNCRMIFAKILGKPVVFFVGSPGPFHKLGRKLIAKNVLNNIDLVICREPISTELLIDIGIDQKRLVTTACPAFLFEANKDNEIETILRNESIIPKMKPLVGLIICGWNMPIPPFSKIPRNEEELEPFAELIRHLIKKLNVRVLLMSHQNRTDEKGNLVKGPDHYILSQLYHMLDNENYDNDLMMLKGLYDASTSKAIIAHFDMLISGRIHGAVAGLSQCIPTVIVDYGHEPKAHKLRGFAELVAVEQYVCNPNSSQDMIQKSTHAWENRTEFKTHLSKRIPEVKALAISNFSLLRRVIE